MSSLKLAVLCGSYQRPSRTLALSQSITTELAQHFSDITSSYVEIAEIGRVLGGYLQRSELPADIEEKLQLIENADLLIAASPVYRGSYTGLFKHCVDLLGMNSLIGKPVLLAATGGSAYHALIVEHQLRPLFACMMANTLPLGIFASEADFTDYQLTSPAISKRIQQAVELALPHLRNACPSTPGGA